MRKLASIRKIEEIKNIPKYDRVEYARIDGWWVIISKKDGFKVGDLCVYIEIDSKVDKDNPDFAFLEHRGYKVKSLKMCGCISQGLIMPLSILPAQDWKEDDDVTDILKITKYDPQAEIENKMIDKLKVKNPIIKFMMRFKWFRKFYGKKVSKTCAFPTELGISKTDESRIQNLSRVHDSFVGKTFSHTEKIDGQSGTYFIYGKTFGVCSRNLWLKKKDMSTSYWQIAEKYNIKDFLKNMQKLCGAKLIVLQGEICGPGIQRNKYDFKEYKFFVFNLKIDGNSLSTPDIKKFIKDTKMETVPYLGEYTFTTVEDILAYVEGKSVLNDKIQREGCVFRLDNVSFKAINNKFLLKYDE